jgi:hypothetical protein
MAMPAAAQAAAKRYLLPHPKREHCHHGYTRRIERHRTWCVRKVRTATITEVRVESSGTFAEEGPSHEKVVGEIGIVGAGSRDLVGEPILYQLENSSTGQVLTTFTQPSNPTYPCAILPNFEGPTNTFTGEAFGSEPACFAGSVQVPKGQVAVLVGSYGGNAAYAPSTSKGQVNGGLG